MPERAFKLFIPFLLLILCACEGPDTPESPPAQAAGSESASQSAPEPDAVADKRAACELSVGWDPWEPYHSMGMDGTVQGMDIDLISALGDEVGCELAYVQGNWASLLKLIRLGELDVLLGATRTEAREDFARFTMPYRDEVFGLYVRPGQAEAWPADTLRELLANGFRLGVTQGYIYGDPIGELQMDPEFSNQFFEATVGEQHFARLMDHTIDGFLEDPFVVAAITRRRGWEHRVEAHPLSFSTGPVRMMFSRASVPEETVSDFDEALVAFRASGGLQELRERYLGTD